MAWNKKNPVINKAVLKEVLNKDPNLLLQRRYEDLFTTYNALALSRGLKKATMPALQQQLRWHFNEWDKTLKEGGTLS